MKFSLKVLFVLIFAFLAIYILKIETERYKSVSIVLLKDLSKKQNMELSGLALSQTSNTMQDSKVLELYIRSNEMFKHINTMYNLEKYYTGEKLDAYQRLYSDAFLPMYRANKLNLLKKYNDDLSIVFDEPSGTLSLSFVHTNPETAQSILKEIITYSDIIINKFDKENSKVSLGFIKKQKEEDKTNFNKSIKKLIAYQNKHHTIDPNLDVSRKNTILANLEAELIKMEVEYSSKSKTYNLNGSEMKILNATISNIKKSISRVKSEMVGSGDLNANVFNFELLRNNMVFNKEIYKQALTKHEEVKLEVSQNAKHLVTISNPTLPDGYSYPNKVWDLFTLFVILVFLYNILITIMAIIEDHKD